MSKRVFDVDIDLSENQVYGLVLERVNNLSIPALNTEARFLYHQIKKLPIFNDGLGFRFLVTEDYVNALLGGLAWKDEVVVASGVNVPLNTLINGVTIDDVTLGTGNRVLLLNQTDPTENGVWLVGTVPERPYDLDDSGDFNNAVVPVKLGTTYAGWVFRCKNVDPDIGIDEIEFVDMTPSVPDASETVKGKIRIALLSAVIAGSEADTVVTPATLKAVIDPIKAQLASIAPAPPEGLSGRVLTMTLYSALEESTGITRQCTDDDTPSGSINDFYDGDNGTLTVEIDTVVEGTRVLSTASDIGVYGALSITDDSDPIPSGELGHGLYKQLSASVLATTGLSLGEHTYKMLHSLTGETNLLTFFVDDPGSVTITGVSLVLPVLLRMVSGVPSLDVGDVVSFDFDVNNAVRTHYNPIRLARIQSMFTQSINIAPPSTPPSNGGVVSYTGEGVQVLSSVYSENVEVGIIGYNSKDVGGTTYDININSRVDTMSDETNRVEAGSGQYPAGGFGGTFGSNQNLKTYYTEELQLLNGKYQWPSGNYSSNQPTAGPDYSIGMGTLTRWCLLDLGITLDNASSFILTLPEIEGTWSGVETEGIQIQVKVDLVTGWMDANKAFALIGAPINDGDACMVFSESSESVKKVSFGNEPRSGKLYIRIGLPSTSDKKFGQGINVSNIV